MKILFFHSDDCPGCPRVERHVDQLENVEKIDVQKSPELALTYGVMSLPTVIVLDDDGAQIECLVGASKNVIKKLGEL